MNDSSETEHPTTNPNNFNCGSSELGKMSLTVAKLTDSWLTVNVNLELEPRRNKLKKNVISLKENKTVCQTLKLLSIAPHTVLTESTIVASNHTI